MWWLLAAPIFVAEVYLLWRVIPMVGPWLERAVERLNEAHGLPPRLPSETPEARTPTPERQGR